ncbi:hypothetical protein CF067_17580 [Clostridium sporogenes]
MTIINSNASSHATGNNTVSITNRNGTTIIKANKLVNNKYSNTAKTNSATTILIQSSLDI